MRALADTYDDAGDRLRDMARTGGRVADRRTTSWSPRALARHRDPRPRPRSSRRPTGPDGVLVESAGLGGSTRSRSAARSASSRPPTTHVTTRSRCSTTWSAGCSACALVARRADRRRRALRLLRSERRPGDGLEDLVTGTPHSSSTSSTAVEACSPASRRAAADVHHQRRRGRAGTSTRRATRSSSRSSTPRRAASRPASRTSSTHLGDMAGLSHGAGLARSTARSRSRPSPRPTARSSTSSTCPGPTTS